MRPAGLIKAALAATLAFSLAGTNHAQALSHHHLRNHRAKLAAAGHVIQCVAFARAASDVVLTGNAVNWWQKAEGVYARGTAPEVGSVLNFRANSRMRLGHVAVVAQITDSRTIQIDQSHWHANGISRDVTVIDVSQNNDWSAVRVAINHAGTYGSIYPTYGFIYPRADHSGRIVTARSDAALPFAGNSAPSDLRTRETEVAEIPGSDLASGPINDDAPNRSLQ